MTGLKLIIGYKLIKGALVLLLGLALLGVLLAGRAAEVRELAMALREHLVGAWSLSVAERLVDAVTPGHLKLLFAGLMLDGSLTLVEGWALHRRWPWGAWLVVITTSALVPFETAALMREVHLGRALVLAANLAVVAYLVLRSAREHAQHRLFLANGRPGGRSL